MVDQINFSLLLSETDISEMNPSWDQAMVSDYASISRSLNSILDTTAVKGLVFTFTGNGASAPVLGTNFNVASLTRISTGVYRAVYQDKIINGTDITLDAIKTSGSIFFDNADHRVEIIAVSLGSFDIRVWTITASVKTAYDLVPGDQVDILIMLNSQSEFSP